MTAVDGGLADVEGLHDVVVEDDHATAGERAHGQLFLAGDAEFADDEDIEGQAQIACDLKGDGDATARESQDDGVVQTGQRTERAGKGASRIMTILKEHRNLLWAAADQATDSGNCARTS